MREIETDRWLDFGSPEEYELLPELTVTHESGCSEERLRIDAEDLGHLAERAFSRIAYFYPKGHLERVAAIVADECADERERFVADFLLRNAAISAEGFLPLCQDTGTALVYGWKGHRISSGGADDAAQLSRGAGAAYKNRALRASQLGPTEYLAELNTGDNLPAAVDIQAVPGAAYRFLFAAKGGGSTSRTSLSMESPAILEASRFKAVLEKRIENLGTAGCPPYTIGVVLGGATPSQTMKTLELAVYGLHDALPGKADGSGMALRSAEWERIALELAAGTGLGAQWGGSHLALEARMIRLSRHAANLPLAVGVSCNAHRRARAYVDASGYHLEKLEEDPARFIPAHQYILPDPVRIDLDEPRSSWMAKLAHLHAGATVLLSGTVAVARDKAHARISSMIAAGKAVPSCLIEHPVFYAGPTEALPGMESGSFGPTTASRMDPFLGELLSRGASLVSIAKGGRSEAARQRIAESGGTYLACVGGAAAITARKHILSSTVVDFADLGMESIRQVVLRDLPAIVMIDSKGKVHH